MMAILNSQNIVRLSICCVVQMLMALVQMSGNQETYENYEDSEFERIGSIQYVTYLEDVLGTRFNSQFL